MIGSNGILSFAREYSSRSTNGVGGHSLSRLYPLTPLAGAGSRGIMVAGAGEVWARNCSPGGGGGGEAHAIDLSRIAIGGLFCSRGIIFCTRYSPSLVLGAPLLFFNHERA